MADSLFSGMFPTLESYQPRPEERTPELVEGCARLKGRPQARSCPWPSFETAARSARPPQDEVRGFEFDRSMRLSFVRRHRHIHPARDVLDRARRARHDIEIEYVGRQPQGRAGIGNVDDAGDMPLHRRGAKDGVGPRLRVAE